MSSQPTVIQSAPRVAENEYTQAPGMGKFASCTHDHPGRSTGATFPTPAVEPLSRVAGGLEGFQDRFVAMPAATAIATRTSTSAKFSSVRPSVLFSAEGCAR